MRDHSTRPKNEKFILTYRYRQASARNTVLRNESVHIEQHLTALCVHSITISNKVNIFSPNISKPLSLAGGY